MEWLHRWWLEATAGGGMVVTIVRWWLSHRSNPTGPGPFQRFMQWVQLAKRLENKDAAEALTKQHIASIEKYTKDLVIDRDFYQAQNAVLRARIRELETELAGCDDSASGSTATPGTKTPPRKRRPRPSVRRKPSTPP
jgi:hypothetical protein